VDGDRGGAVFQIVILLVGLVGQLAFFPDRHKSRPEFDGGGGGEDFEAPGVMPTIASTMPA